MIFSGLSLLPAQARATDQGPALEADISIVEQRPQENDQIKDITIKEKKIHISWESLGLQSMREGLKKLKAKNILSAISLKYLYRHLWQMALSEHDRYIGNPYEREERTENKLAHAQTILMKDYVRLLSDPAVMAQMMRAENGGSIGNGSPVESLATRDMANLLSPEEAVDFFVSELTQQPFFPQDPADYNKIKELALKWGAIPIGLIVLGTKLHRDNLGGKISLPVFMLPSGYLGLAFMARVDHIGLTLSPRLVGQGEIVLMRFRIKGTVEEKRGKLFSPDGRNFELELSEDWSNLFLKRFGLNSHFYYKNRHQLQLTDRTQNLTHEVGLNVNAIRPGHLFGVVPYTNFNAKVSFDSLKNVQGNLVLKYTMPNYLWSVAMNGTFNFATQAANFSGQTQITKRLKDGTGLSAGLNLQAGSEGHGVGGLLEITEESRNLSGRLNFSLHDNHAGPIKWQVGVGVAGKLESQKRLDEKYLRHLDWQMRSNLTLFESYEAELFNNVESLIKGQNSASFDPDKFEESYQMQIMPLAFSLEQVGQVIERSLKEYQTLTVEFDRKYGDKDKKCERLGPEVLVSINGLLPRYHDLKAKGLSNLRASILFLALAEHVKAD